MYEFRSCPSIIYYYREITHFFSFAISRNKKVRPYISNMYNFLDFSCIDINPTNTRTIFVQNAS